MATYVKITDFASKDALLSGNPAKIVKGSEIGAEFDALTTADASNVKGPVSAVVDNSVPRWDTTTGRIVQGSGVTINDSNVVAGASIDLGGNTLTGTTAQFNAALSDGDFTTLAGTETLTNKTLTSPAINGGTINNASVGATTPSTGAFTTLSASGAVSNTSGGFYTNGSLGIAQASTTGVDFNSGSSRLVSFGAAVNNYGSFKVVLVDSAGGGAAPATHTFTTTGLSVTGIASATKGYYTDYSGSASGSISANNRYLGQWEDTTNFREYYSGVDASTYPVVTTYLTKGGGGSAVAVTTTSSTGLSVTGALSSYVNSTYQARLATATGNYTSGGLVFGGQSPDSSDPNYYGAVGYDHSTGKTYLRNKFYNATGGIVLQVATTGGFSDAVTVDASGNLLVGTTVAPDATFVCKSNFRGVQVENPSDTSKWRQMAFANNSSDAALYFPNGSNSPTLSAAGAWTNASDGRQKTNIAAIKYGLATVLSAQPRSYNRVDVDGEFIGFIAQELQQVIPEVVFGSEETSYSVDYGSLVAVAFKAIQEQETRIAQLEADKATLLQVLASVDDRLAALESR